MNQLEDCAALVDEAAFMVTPIPQLSRSGCELTLKEAYAVQALSIDRRKQRGEKVVGIKMGFTSRAKMAQMGIDELICGRITDGMLVEDGSSMSIGRFIHPRVEPELAFLMKRRLTGNITLLHAQDAIEAVAPALEIIDSRYADFRFSLTDVVADNSSSAAVLIGAWRRPRADISNLGMVMSFNGRPVQIGSSAAILGNPFRSLVAAARLLADQGAALESGWIVMAGGATAAEPLASDLYVSLDVEQLGGAEFTVTA